MFLLTGTLCLAAVAVAKDWHYGAAFGIPFDTSTDCNDINNISPELLINWGPNNRDDGTMNVCDNPSIDFVPYLWGQTWDDSELDALPEYPVPWGVIFENEPNWVGGPGPTDPSTPAGCNFTATYAASKYAGHCDVINEKWGVGVVKLISPSPVDKYYPVCTTDPPLDNCAWQPQFSWLDEYFDNCGTCYHDIWAINQHDYSCNLESTQSLVADLSVAYPGKNIFFGELGCNGVSADDMAQYLMDFVSWAYYVPTIVGFIWAGINDVGTPGSELSLNGKLTSVGEVFKMIQQDYPPITLPI